MNDRILKALRFLWAVFWICIWLTAYYHYETVGEYFVTEDMLSKIPLAYVAVESWYLLAMIILMYISWEFIKVTIEVFLK